MTFVPPLKILRETMPMPVFTVHQKTEPPVGTMEITPLIIGLSKILEMKISFALFPMNLVPRRVIPIVEFSEQPNLSIAKMLSIIGRFWTLVRIIGFLLVEAIPVFSALEKITVVTTYSIIGPLVISASGT